MPHGESFDSSQGQILDSGFSSLNNGSLTNNNTLLVELEVPPTQGTVILQDDGTFVYMHNGSDVLLDEFSYRVTNEDGVFTIATVSITIDPPIEPPIGQAIEPPIDPVPAAIIDPLDNTAVNFEPIVAPVDIAATEEATEIEVVQTAEEPTQSEQTAGETTLFLPENSSSDTRTTTYSSQVATQVLPQVNTFQREIATLESIAVTQHRETQVITNYNELQILSNATYDLVLDVYVPSAKATASNPSFLDGLTRIENELEEAEERSGARYKLLEDSVLGASFSVTVGILAWTLRGGAMLASVMTFTPLWKFIEMGQVTQMVAGPKRNADDEEPDEEDTEVESLFDE